MTTTQRRTNPLHLLRLFNLATVQGRRYVVHRGARVHPNFVGLRPSD